MATCFPFEVHTPYRLFYSGAVEAIVVTLSDGEIGVYAGHAFFTAPVITGILKIRESGGLWRSAFIAEGILEVKGHKTILMTDAAEWPEEIDTERALGAQKKAEETLGTAVFKFETDRARDTLRRAEYRLKVSGLGENPH
jgi:F-type H+-transporting ATPase subunit epsilon